MPTTDLVATYGGVADGQRVTLTATISNDGSSRPRVLTVSGGTPFVLGDVGKAIFLNASGYQFPTGSTVATIASFTSSTVINLSADSAALSSAATDILWGTDNTAAFMAYRTWAQAQGSSQAQLTVPAGRYCANLDPAHPLNKGVKNALISGPLNAAATCIIPHLTAAEQRLGGDAPIGFGLGFGNSARLATCNAGATTATLVDKTNYGSLITVGAYCFITAYDMQGITNGGFGYPPNPFYFEPNIISAYDGSTGTITFQSALRNTYKSTYPQWDPGDAGHSDQGGPATIYVLADYDRVVEINDITLDSPYNQIASHGRDLISRRCVHPGLYPTQNATFSAYGSSWGGTEIEIDKIDDVVLFDACTMGILRFQSASPNVCTIQNGCTISQIQGSPKVLSMSDSAVGQVNCGAQSFGRTDEITITNCTGINTFASGGSGTAGIHGVGVSTSMPLTSGVFRFLKTDNDAAGGQENPSRGLMPGTWLLGDNKFAVLITDVTEDGTYAYFQTNLAGSWPVTFTTLRCSPAPRFTMRNCTGSAPELEDWNHAPARIPLWSYSKRTYTADGSGTTAKVTPFVVGRLSTFKATVTTPGSVTFHESQFDNWTAILKSDYSAYTFTPTIDCVNAGLRTVTGAAAATGAQGADSLPDLTSVGQIWFWNTSNSGPNFSANGSNAVVTVEFVMDQGIPSAGVMPLRFRLHA